MKIISCKSGEFCNEVRFSRGEIDELMQNHYYNYMGKAFEMKSPKFNLQDFMEKYLFEKGIEFDPVSDELEGDILGRTIFNADGSSVIQINSKLKLNNVMGISDGRYNFTLAHEIFHALYHRPLFLDKNQSEISCLNRDIFPKKNAEKQPLHEIQANNGAAALLMPIDVFTYHYETKRNDYGVKTNCELLDCQDFFNNVVAYLSKTFGASNQAVKIRLRVLGLLQDKQGGDECSVGGFLQERRFW